MENIAVRKEVRSIINRIAPYLNEKSVDPPEFIEGILDDIMGLYNREFRGTYTEEAVTTMLKKRDADFQRDKEELMCSIQDYHNQVEQLKIRNKALQNAVTTDTVKKELERKIAILQDKNKMLKKIVRASLEDL